MKKSDIETRRERGYGRDPLPALNVKVYNCGPTASAVAKRFGCDESTAEKALQYAFESAQECFWEGAEELAREIFGAHVKVYSAGRSGGWLVVDNLEPVASWDAIAVGKWARFARLIAQDIAWRCADEQVFGDIDANEWAKPGAELYNFVDTAAGPKCIADLKSEARAAGFGPVIR